MKRQEDASRIASATIEQEALDYTRPERTFAVPRSTSASDPQQTWPALEKKLRHEINLAAPAARQMALIALELGHPALLLPTLTPASTEAGRSQVVLEHMMRLGGGGTTAVL